MAASASGSVTLHDYRNVKALNAEEQQELKDMMRKDQQVGYGEVASMSMPGDSFNGLSFEAGIPARR